MLSVQVEHQRHTKKLKLPVQIHDPVKPLCSAAHSMTQDHALVMLRCTDQENCICAYVKPYMCAFTGVQT